MKHFKLIFTVLILCLCSFAWAEDSSSPITYQSVDGAVFAMQDGHVVEPESSLDIFSMSFSDFGSFFTDLYDVTVSSYVLCKGKSTATAVYHIHSDNPGPCIYIVAGIHGDERAAWYAGVLLSKATISCGDLYVLSQANIVGAKKVSRYVQAGIDPNRQFPGKKGGNLTQNLCYEIYTDIQDKNPDLVLDLHEAIIFSPETRDFLGSTYIVTDFDPIGDLVWDMLDATADGTICHNEFSMTGPGPSGSINATVSNVLNIPVITVETFRGFDIYRRVSDQLDSVEFVLEYYGMRNSAD